MRITHFAAIPGIAESVHGHGEPTMLFAVDADDVIYMMPDPNVDAEWIQLPGLPKRIVDEKLTALVQSIEDRTVDRSAQREVL